jgi:hypothetical protein
MKEQLPMATLQQLPSIPLTIKSAIEALAISLLLLFACSSARAVPLYWYDGRAEFDRALNGHLMIDFDSMVSGLTMEQLKVQRAIFKTDVVVENGTLLGADEIDLSKGHYNAFGAYFHGTRETFTFEVSNIDRTSRIIGRLPTNDFYGFTIHGGMDWARITFSNVTALDNVIVGRGTPARVSTTPRR